MRTDHRNAPNVRTSGWCELDSSPAQPQNATTADTGWQPSDTAPANVTVEVTDGSLVEQARKTIVSYDVPRETEDTAGLPEEVRELHLETTVDVDLYWSGEIEHPTHWRPLRLSSRPPFRVGEADQGSPTPPKALPGWTPGTGPDARRPDPRTFGDRRA